jgi:metal-dependent amidase/aminoacylase/carboxypeptidase family protein
MLLACMSGQRKYAEGRRPHTDTTRFRQVATLTDAISFRSIPSGTIASRAGPLLAACERFEILISGVGGHVRTMDPSK